MQKLRLLPADISVRTGSSQSNSLHIVHQQSCLELNQLYGSNTRHDNITQSVIELTDIQSDAARTQRVLAAMGVRNFDDLSVLQITLSNAVRCVLHRITCRVIH